jgi:hypothetical protein
MDLVWVGGVGDGGGGDEAKTCEYIKRLRSLFAKIIPMPVLALSANIPLTSQHNISFTACRLDILKRWAPTESFAEVRQMSERLALQRS